MANWGPWQMALVLLILVVVVGGTRLPKIGDGLGKAIRNFKRGLSSDDDIDVTPQDKRVGEDADE